MKSLFKLYFSKLALLGLTLVMGMGLISTNALAHDGHHEPGLAVNLWHLFTEPDHLLLFVAVALLVSVAFFIVRNRKVKQLKQIK